MDEEVSFEAWSEWFLTLPGMKEVINGS